MESRKILLVIIKNMFIVISLGPIPALRRTKAEAYTDGF